MKYNLTPLEISALDLLECIRARKDAYEEVDDQLTKLQGDFPTHVHCMDEQVENCVVKFIDEVLNLEDLASYYLYECVGKHGHGGGITCCNKRKKWQLRNDAELRAYIAHARVCPGTKLEAAE